MEYCLEKWGTIEVEGKKSAEKGTSAKKSGENLSISGEQKMLFN